MPFALINHMYKDDKGEVSPLFTILWQRFTKAFEEKIGRS